MPDSVIVVQALVPGHPKQQEVLLSPQLEAIMILQLAPDPPVADSPAPPPPPPRNPGAPPHPGLPPPPPVP